MSQPDLILRIAAIVLPAAALYTLMKRGLQRRVVIGSYLVFASWIAVGVAVSAAADGSFLRTFFRSEYAAAFWMAVFGTLFVLFDVRRRQHSRLAR